jgi:hypothetical protein
MLGGVGVGVRVGVREMHGIRLGSGAGAKSAIDRIGF